MSNKITDARHLSPVVTGTTPRQTTHAGAVIMAGLLSLSLCPALALAAPSGQGGPQAMGENPPAMQQPTGDMQQPTGDMQQREAPADMQDAAPSNQSHENDAAPSQDFDGRQGPEGSEEQNVQMTAPEFQREQPGTNEGNRPMESTDDEVRAILSEDYGVNAAMPDHGDNDAKPTEAPEIPEGEINVQKIIDSVRDTLRYCAENQLETIDFEDEDITTSIANQIMSADAQRQEEFAQGKKLAPQDPQDDRQTPSETEVAKETPRDAPSADAADEAPAAPGILASIKSDNTMLGKIVSFIARIFGYEN